MNGNFKYTLTDEQRNRIHNNLSGKATKKMITRAEVSALLQKALDDLVNGKRQLAALEHREEEAREEQPKQILINLSDYSEEDVADLVKQNELLLSRLNRLQHRLDLEYAS